MWWQYIIIAAVILFGIYGFLVLTRFETRNLSRRTKRTAADVYPSYADSIHKQVCHEHGRQREVAEAVERGAVREMKDGWPFGAALRGEASNRPLLR